MNMLKTMLMVLSASALTATAQPDGFGGPRQHEGRGPRGPGLSAMLENEQVVEKLGLTPDQVTALRERADTAEKTLIKLRAEVELAEVEVRRLLRDEKPDRAAVMKAVEAAGAAQLALRKAIIEERLAFREIAGPEAARKAHQMVKRNMQRDDQGDENRPHWRERKGSGEGLGPGPGRSGPPMEE